MAHDSKKAILKQIPPHQSYQHQGQSSRHVCVTLQITEGGQSNYSDYPGQRNGQSLRDEHPGFSSWDGNFRSVGSYGQGATLRVCYEYGYFGHLSKECPRHIAFVPIVQNIQSIRVVPPPAKGSMQGHWAGPQGSYRGPLAGRVGDRLGTYPSGRRGHL